MLVCHKDVPHFEGQSFARGDVVNDPVMESKILAFPQVKRNFTPAVHPPDTAPYTAPAIAPRVAAGMGIDTAQA